MERGFRLRGGGLLRGSGKRGRWGLCAAGPSGQGKEGKKGLDLAFFSLPRLREAGSRLVFSSSSFPISISRPCPASSPFPRSFSSGASGADAAAHNSRNLFCSLFFLQNKRNRRKTKKQVRCFFLFFSPFPSFSNAPPIYIPSAQ